MSDSFKTYIFKIENEKLRLEYSYYARDVDSDIVIGKSEITVQLIKKANPLVEYLPDIILWEINFKNKFVPLYPFYPFKFVELFDDFVFIAIENELIKLDLANGLVIWSKKIANTDIQFVSKVNTNLILLFNPDKFDIDKYSCNLKMVTINGELQWTAKSIDKLYNQLYYGVETSRGKIEAWSGSMYTCVDKINGNIEPAQFVK